jgi:hypothetical protein
MALTQTCFIPERSIFDPAHRFRQVAYGGISGRCKNLIFAANGPKPQLVLADALNNDIRITKHGDFCLVYDLPIGIEGLRWQELVQPRGGLLLRFRSSVNRRTR